MPTSKDRPHMLKIIGVLKFLLEFFKLAVQKSWERFSWRYLWRLLSSDMWYISWKNVISFGGERWLHLQSKWIYMYVEDRDTILLWKFHNDHIVRRHIPEKKDNGLIENLNRYILRKLCLVILLPIPRTFEYMNIIWWVYRIRRTYLINIDTGY